MRKINVAILAFLLSGVMNYSYGQVQSPVDSLTFQKRMDNQIQSFQLKSKRQKTLGWILLGGGLGLNIIGSSVQNGDVDGTSNAGQILAGVGGASIIASIPVFFSSSKNKNRAQMVYFQKNIDLAQSDSSRRIILDDAIRYFKSKESSNKITAIVLSAAGAGFLIGGITMSPKDNSDVFSGIFNDFFKSLLIISGATYGILSIPFYVRAAEHRHTANSIIKNGRVPDPVLSISPTMHAGTNYFALGFKMNF